jgi:DNA-binding beta-propeller fold protein YncE
MSIDVKCPQCGSQLEAPDEAAGKKVKCPDCGTRIPVPGAAAAIQPPPAARPAERAVQTAKDEPEEEERPRRRRRDEEDEEDDDRPRRRRQSAEDDAVSTLIPYKNGRALAGYYCGVFSLVPCLGLILGPIALVFGILGLRFVRAHPQAHGTAHAWVGIILGSLTTLANWGVVIVIVAAGGIAALRSGTPTTSRTAFQPPPNVQGPGPNPDQDRMKPGKPPVPAGDLAAVALQGMQQPTAAAFSPDSARLAVAGLIQVKVWDVAKWGDPWPIDGGAFSVAFSPDGKLLARAQKIGNAVSLHDPATHGYVKGLTRAEVGGDARAVAFPADGKSLAVLTDKALTVFDTAGWQKRPATLKVEANQAKALAFSPNGQMLAVVQPDNAVRVIDVAGMKERTAINKPGLGSAVAVAFSHDGKALAIGTGEGKVTLWDLEQGKESFTFQAAPQWAHAVAFAPDGKLLACGSQDGMMKLWDLTTHKERVARKPDPNGNSVTLVAFSPDGKTLLSGCSNTGTLKAWDVNQVLAGK